MIKPTKRVSKKTGEVSYLLRVNLGFVNGEQIIKSKTWKPDRKMTPAKMDEEAYKQLVFLSRKLKPSMKLSYSVKPSKSDLKPKNN